VQQGQQEVGEEVVSSKQGGPKIETCFHNIILCSKTGVSKKAAELEAT